MKDTPTSQDVLEKIVQEIADKLKQGNHSYPECVPVLIVEDNEFDRFILVQLLDKYGLAYKVV